MVWLYCYIFLLILVTLKIEGPSFGTLELLLFSVCFSIKMNCVKFLFDIYKIHTLQRVYAAQLFWP